VLRYANSCRATSRSSSLDETGRLEIGRYKRGLVGSISASFMRGVTYAALNTGMTVVVCLLLLTALQQGILGHWVKHLSELLNGINPHDPTFLDLLPQFPCIPDLDVTPSLRVSE